MNIFITFYNLDSSRTLFISAGFFFTRHLLEGDDLFISQTETKEEVEKIFSEIPANTNRIYCTLNYSFETELIADFVDDRWVIGGPEAVEIIREGTSPLLTRCELTAKSFESMCEVPPSTKFTYYFEDLVAKLNPRAVSYPCAIGSGCYWNNCTFCSFHLYSGETSYKTKANITEIINNLKPLSVPSQVHTCVSSCSSKVLDQLLAASVPDGIILSEFIRADEDILEFIKTTNQTAFKNHFALLGMETFSQSVSDRLNKGASVANYLLLLEYILSRGGSVALYIMTWIPFVDEIIVNESLPVIKELERIVSKYPKERFSVINSGEVLWPTEELAQKMGNGLKTYKSFKHMYGALIEPGSTIAKNNQLINQALQDSSLPIRGETLKMTYSKL